MAHSSASSPPIPLSPFREKSNTTLFVGSAISTNRILPEPSFGDTKATFTEHNRNRINRDAAPQERVQMLLNRFYQFSDQDLRQDFHHFLEDRFVSSSSIKNPVSHASASSSSSFFFLSIIVTISIVVFPLLIYQLFSDFSTRHSSSTSSFNVRVSISVVHVILCIILVGTGWLILIKSWNNLREWFCCKIRTIEASQFSDGDHGKIDNSLFSSWFERSTFRSRATVNIKSAPQVVNRATSSLDCMTKGPLVEPHDSFRSAEEVIAYNQSSHMKLFGRFISPYLYCVFLGSLQCLLLLALFRRALKVDCPSTGDSGVVATSSTDAGYPSVPSLFAFSGNSSSFDCENVNNYLISLYGIILHLLPCFLFMSLPQLSIEVIWTTLVLSFAGFLSVVIYIMDMYSLVVVIIVFISMICLVLDCQLVNVHTFLTYRRIHELLQENERMAEENQSNELRSMIGNVAHDLKTPLASFVTGVDYIQDAMNEIRQTLVNASSASAVITSANTNRRHKSAASNVNVGNIDGLMPSMVMISLVDTMDAVQSCITNIRNTNSFMLMTINRCIDYTKASKGLKLVPRYETVDLLDALELPLSCMQNIQNRIVIACSTLPLGICSHIITDKQWLQENILCLLSNAVKYSTGGKVSVTISLEERIADSITYSQDGNSVTSDSNKINQRSGNEVLSGGRNVEEGKDSSSSKLSVRTMDNSSSNSSRGESAGLVLQPFQVMDRRNILRDKRLQQFLRFEVEDTGIGMSEDAMASLFNPFKQTQRLAGGTGLGLYSLAKRLEALHGFYGVQKRRDGQQGSLFWFAIPYRPDGVTAALITSKSRFNGSLDEVALKKLMSNFVDSTNNPDKSKSIDIPTSFSSRLHTDIKQVINNKIPSVSTSTVNTLEVSGSTEFSEVVVTDKVTKQQLVRVANHSSVQSCLVDGHTPAKTSSIIAMVEKSNATIQESAHGSLLQSESASQCCLSILVVDDSPPILKMTSLMLKRLGHKITTAENGAIALRLVEDHWYNSKLCFDVILMDLQMPVMDGLEATKRIRGLEASGLSSASVVDYSTSKVSPDIPITYPKLPKQFVIGMSANSDHETTIHAFEAGIDTFMAKPFTVETFKSTVDAAVQLNKVGGLTET